MDNSSPDPDLVAELEAIIADLEAELARYSALYGMTEEARRLFTRRKTGDPGASTPPSGTTKRTKRSS